MRTKTVTLLLAAAGLLLASGFSASAQSGRAPNATNPSAADPASEDWRERATRARAAAPEAAPPRGRLRKPEDGADRGGREETVGAGDLGIDRGDGGKEE